MFLTFKGWDGFLLNIEVGRIAVVKAHVDSTDEKPKCMVYLTCEKETEEWVLQETAQYVLSRIAAIDVEKENLALKDKLAMAREALAAIERKTDPDNLDNYRPISANPSANSTLHDIAMNALAAIDGAKEGKERE